MLQSFNNLPRWLSIGLAFPLIFLNGWLLFLLAQQLEPLVSILITATLIAFLLDYPIRFLQKLGVKRIWSVALVFLIFVLIVSALVLVLGPLVLRQANELITRLPDWIKSGQQQLKSLETWATDQQLPIDVSSNITQLVERLSLTLRSLTSQLISLTLSAISSIVNIFLTLVFAIFLVLRGESLWNGILGWLPPRWNDQIRNSLPQNFEGYIAGQATLAVILSVSQTIVLVVLGAPLTLLFGLMIGTASLIPFGGTTAILTVSLLLALQNFWLGVKVLIVAEGPRILGEITGLNPVWTLISLFLGVKLGGVLGLIIAVPFASFIKGTTDTIRRSGATPPTLVKAEMVAIADSE
ncbi:MAG: AI-2E family transporter [Oculatellaceae cyanobacterium Prado106]|nr:AI-2E family transporter [Oculatellaceae cyanobacterium Prado106]